MPSPDTIVVGAGAFGGWTALHLQRQGHQVRLLDCQGAGHASASSGGETRVIRMGYSDPLYVRMAQRALALWQAFDADLPEPVFQRTGVLFMAQQAGLGFLDAVCSNFDTLGVRHERLHADEVAARFPQIDVQGVQRATYEPDSGLLFARRACAAVVDAFVRTGGEYRLESVRPGACRGGRMSHVVDADCRTHSAAHYVFACGPWLPRLFPDVLGKQLRVSRQEAMYFRPPDGNRAFDPDRLPVWADFGDTVYYGLPGNAARGFKIADDTRGPDFDPDSSDRLVSQDSVDAVRGYMGRRFPAMAHAPLVEARVCQYTNTVDDHFLLDRHPEADNVWLVGGGSGHGFKHGPAMGEQVAACVLGQAVPEPVFALDRRPR